jgi:cystathionine gamma-synthase
LVGRSRKSQSQAGVGTRAVWAGESGQYWEGATQIPVALSVSFGYEDVNQWFDVAQGKTAGHIYSRNTNPTVAVLEEKVRDLETAQAATSFSSGMAAISNTLFALLSPGDRVVSSKDTAERIKSLSSFCHASASTWCSVKPTITKR